MKYLIVDGNLHGTGIRDKYNGGYLPPNDLKLTDSTIDQINKWLSRYEQEHFNGFLNKDNVAELDEEGKIIAKKIRNELAEVKIEYFSAAKMVLEKI